MKKTTALFGSNSFNSAASWAAKTLLGVIIKVGFFTFSITHAVVADFPVPVAPWSITFLSHFANRDVIFLIAFG